jgi:hypothetical protein
MNTIAQQIADLDIEVIKMTNKDKFIAELTSQYFKLFSLPDYAMAAARYTPGQLALKITDGLLTGESSKEGDGVKRTCKALYVTLTYKAIREYLQGN